MAKKETQAAENVQEQAPEKVQEQAAEKVQEQAAENVQEQAPEKVNAQDLMVDAGEHGKFRFALSQFIIPGRNNNKPIKAEEASQEDVAYLIENKSSVLVKEEA
jgi:tRNA A37 methylthiotransferase MiaB